MKYSNPIFQDRGTVFLVPVKSFFNECLEIRSTRIMDFRQNTGGKRPSTAVVSIEAADLLAQVKAGSDVAPGRINTLSSLEQ